MSNILEMITSELGAGDLAKLGSAIGASPQQTQSAVAAALPALIGGLARNTRTTEGANSLASALERDHVPSLESQFQSLGGDALGGLVSSFLGGGQQAQGSNQGLGNLLGAAVSIMAQSGSDKPKALDGAGILGHILGGRRNNVEQGVAKASGLDLATVAKLLPALAPIVMSALGSLKKGQQLDAGGLAGMLAQEEQQLAKGSSRNQGGLADLLDMDNDGSMVDELVAAGGALANSGLLGKLFQ